MPTNALGPIWFWWAPILSWFGIHFSWGHLHQVQSTIAALLKSDKLMSTVQAYWPQVYWMGMPSAQMIRRAIGLPPHVFTRIFDDMASGTWRDISSKSENIPHRTTFFTTNHSVSSNEENSILHKALTSAAVRIKLPTKSLKVVGFSIYVHVGHSARWGLSI